MTNKEYLNRYKCPNCGCRWNDVWDCACDDECPDCGVRNISPYDYEELETNEES